MLVPFHLPGLLVLDGTYLRRRLMPKRKKRSDLLVSFFFIGILSYLNVYLISII